MAAESVQGCSWRTGRCSILSTFDIFPPLDEFGNPVKLQATMSPGVLSFPIPFKCIIKPRSDAAAALIHGDSVDAA
ncbi:hypothetical protein PILCRDRAFT_823836 [Piloderma croceum F 1598]|uniref:Uncharacterized protein n=1 Tax=Piloderma croceum (strain F 1598) TaxID=765440 RepID=A0A0C3FGM2_PILCF|nr:hypothetical protein PILCRDRAFT_823836 [Piloderma croceum F 1598]